jgi:hypothetical protein
MLVGTSEKVNKMVEYHYLVLELRKHEADLDVAARIFMQYVDLALPQSGENHWATFIYPDKETVEKSQKELMGDLMFGPDPQPMRLAQVGARRMDEGNLLRLGAVASLQDEHWVEDLEYREQRILQARKKYMKSVARKQKIRQSNREPWYEAVKTVRRRALGPEVGTPVRVNRLQGALSDEMDNGAVARDKSSSLGETVLSDLAVRNRPAQSPKELEELLEDSTETSNIKAANIKAATWALFLSMVSGRQTPGDLPSWAGIGDSAENEPGGAEQKNHLDCEKAIWN